MGQVGHRVTRPIEQPHLFQGFLGSLGVYVERTERTPEAVTGRSVHLRGDPHVVDHLERGEEIRDLEGARDSAHGAGPLAHRGHVFVEQGNGAFRRGELAGNDPEEGGLPRPVRPDDGEPPAGGEDEAHTIDGGEPTELLGDAVENQGRPLVPEFRTRERGDGWQ